MDASYSGEYSRNGELFLVGKKAKAFRNESLV